MTDLKTALTRIEVRHARHAAAARLNQIIIRQRRELATEKA
jgi:hypothetical protein